MTRTESLEIERKYDVSTQAVVPDLTGITGVARVDDGGTVVLEALYFDLPDRALLRHGITLRRRRGGKDAGWHTKFPAVADRLEVQVPLSGADETPPAEVLDLVRVHVRHRALEPVARITTTRTITTLVGEDGTPLIEISDDVVDAEDLTTGVERSWREWEAEVQGGEPAPDDAREALVDAVEHTLLNAGAAPAGRTSKLARAMGGQPQPVPIDGKPGSVRNVLTASFRQVAAELMAWDPRVRRHEAGSLHQLRVKARTLRSMLKTYRPLLEVAPAGELEGQLKSLGRTLSAARDAEVMQALIPSRIAQRPPGSIPRHLMRRLDKSSAARYEKAYSAVLRDLNSAEYFATLDALDEFTARIPLRGDLKNGGKAATKLPPAVNRQQKIVAKSAQRASRASELDSQLELLHDVRKRSKRLRYAIRSVEGSSGFTFGGQVGKSMKSSETIQNILGTHRDSVLFQEFLLKASRAGRRAGETTFAYGVLHEAEASIQREAETKFRKRIGKLS
ncbi:CYTH and CHAD domain-containing protein [Arthrobacter flavus]|uniref:CYTH and CHAD domain-containing protein n=1 Tax=Arthrobacter flavus TaxID=95172 RepID=A0ABW4Q7H8_9MICC